MLGICAAAPGLASPQADFSVDVKVVSMVAVVRDKQGRLAGGLQQEDFAIEEDGHPQPITYFLSRNELPLMIGLLVDTSFSQWKVLNQEHAASIVFLNEVLRDVDRAFVGTFDANLKMIQEPTSSRSDLENSLRQIPTGTTSKAPVYGTVLFDAVYRSAEVVMKRVQGRHAVILLTDGVDSGSVRSEAAAIEACLRTETAIYSICISDEAAYGAPLIGRGGRGGIGPASDGEGTLKHLSEKTGGGFFVVSPQLTLEQIFKTISDELRSQYNIGYAAPGGKPGFHKVRVIAKRPGLKVRTREGYYSGG